LFGLEVIVVSAGIAGPIRQERIGTRPKGAGQDSPAWAQKPWMARAVAHPCVLDPGNPCRDDASALRDSALLNRFATLYADSIDKSCSSNRMPVLFWNYCETSVSYLYRFKRIVCAPSLAESRPLL